MIRHATAGLAAANTDLGVDVGRVAILNRSTTGADVFARADGTPAAVDGNDSAVIPAGARRTIEVPTDGPTVVSLIATAAGTKVELEA
jgi:hypothetical protein